jgi:hypothetical protein
VGALKIFPHHMTLNRNYYEVCETVLLIPDKWHQLNYDMSIIHHCTKATSNAQLKSIKFELQETEGFEGIV